MLPKGRWRSHKSQKTGSTSQPGPGVYVGPVCMVEASESQGRSQQDICCLLFLLRLILLNNTKAAYASSRVGCPDIKHIAGNALILCGHDKS